MATLSAQTTPSAPSPCPKFQPFQRRRCQPLLIVVVGSSSDLLPPCGSHGRYPRHHWLQANLQGSFQHPPRCPWKCPALADLECFVQSPPTLLRRCGTQKLKSVASPSSQEATVEAVAPPPKLQVPCYAKMPPHQLPLQEPSLYLLKALVVPLEHVFHQVATGQRWRRRYRPNGRSDFARSSSFFSQDLIATASATVVPENAKPPALDLAHPRKHRHHWSIVPNQVALQRCTVEARSSR